MITPPRITSTHFFMSSSKMFSIINYCGLRCLLSNPPTIVVGGLLITKVVQGGRRTKQIYLFFLPSRRPY